MKFLLFNLLFLMYGMRLFAGAPAPSTSLPEPPYVFEKGTLMTAEVDWNKDSLQQFLPKNIEPDKIVNGGIDVFFTRHDKPLTKISYALIWINLENNNKILILGFVGPNYDSNRLIEKVSEKGLTLAKSRLMLINEKVSFRTNINNKLSFNITANMTSECENNKNYSKKMKINESKSFLITSESENVCDLENVNILFTENYSGIKINEVSNAVLYKDAKVIFSY